MCEFGINLVNPSSPPAASSNRRATVADRWTARARQRHPCREIGRRGPRARLVDRRERLWNFILELDGATDGLEGQLRAIEGITHIEHRVHGWHLRCTRDVRPELLKLVTASGVALLQLRSEDPTLEEIYLKYFREA